ncbi:His-Xaa-Ser system protein HxsD [Pseudoxanthomonas sp.]|uniref:His-Xaa-Ser system protein HxsD n=1 Tax=Pseudoxanthomonas sp. TaxID=1871049 RepID=UPI003F7E6091
MESIELELDAQFFSADVVARTVYRYSGDYYVQVERATKVHRITLVPRTSGINTSQLAERFQTDACDDRLREQVALQTGDLQRLLMRAAIERAVSVGDAST